MSVESRVFRHASMHGYRLGYTDILRLAGEQKLYRCISSRSPVESVELERLRSGGWSKIVGFNCYITTCKNGREKREPLSLVAHASIPPRYRYH